MNLQKPHPPRMYLASDISIPLERIPATLIGELSVGQPQNLVPAITQTAIGKIPQMLVYGNDYPTSDGSHITGFYSCV